MMLMMVHFGMFESPNSTYLYLLLVLLLKSKPLEGPGYRVMAKFYSDRDDRLRLIMCKPSMYWHWPNFIANYRVKLTIRLIMCDLIGFGHSGRLVTYELIEMGHLNQSGPNLIGVKSAPVSIHRGGGA